MSDRPVPAGTSAVSRPETATLDPRRTLDALYRVSRLLSEVTNLRSLLEMIMAESKALTEAEASSLLLYDKDRNDLYFEVALGTAGEKVKTIRLAMGEGIGGSCAADRKVIIVNDVKTDDRHAKRADEQTKFVTRNLLAVPLVARGTKLVGVLEVLNTIGRDAFNEDDARILQTFADQAALAIDNAQLIEENLKAERLAAIGVAVAGISHYVKNILAGMTGSAGLVQLGLDTKNLGIIGEAWPIFQRSQKKISTLVQDMLTYSKPRTPEKMPVELNRMVADIAEELTAQAAERGVSLYLGLDENLKHVPLDIVQMHDCLLNLVGNAIDATKGCTPAQVTIRTGLSPDGATAVVQIEDSGVGIPEEQLAKIFEPFYSTKGSKGTGLGLAVVKKIMQEHQGDVLVESTVGAGTTFELHLPMGS